VEMERSQLITKTGRNHCLFKWKCCYTYHFLRGKTD